MAEYDKMEGLAW
uniref:Uncharacterized protein n=1 Tax=mine drainage metagenome TaxID=410659 RepID=E6PWV1_9ZZZZ